MERQSAIQKEVYCYARYSSKKQGSGDSLTRQAELIDRYFELNPDHIKVEDLQDRGISAFKGQNLEAGVLKKFVERIRNREIGSNAVLIVESLDRISRQKELNALNVMTEILASGVVIHTLIDGMTYDITKDNHGMQVSMMQFVLSRAHDESRTKQARSKASWKRKHLEAKSTGKIMTSKVPYWLQIVEDGAGGKKFEIIESRAREIRRAFELSNFKLGCQAIATKLNTEGAEKKWSLIAVRHLLTSKSVYGSLEINKTQQQRGHSSADSSYEEVPNYYPAVIEKDQFYKAQSSIKENKEKHHVKGRTARGFRNLFKGILKCEDCDAYLHQNFVRRKGHEYMYLICRNSLIKACPSGQKVMIPYRFILEPFLLFYKNYNLDKIVDKETDIRGLANRRRALLAEKLDKENVLKNLVLDLQRNDGFLPKAVQNYMIAIEAEIDQIEQDILNVENSMETVKEINRISKEITREEIDKIIDTEEGRIKLNAFLSDAGIKMSVSGSLFEGYRNLWIQYGENSFIENIKISRSHAIIPMMGMYNFRTKTYSDGFGSGQEYDSHSSGELFELHE